MKIKNKILLAVLALSLVFCLSVTTCSPGGGEEDEGSLLGNLEGVSFDTPESPQGFTDPAISAVNLVDGITIGWNLGNTLDAWPNGETSWGNPKTTKAMISGIKESGFNIIRIPVSWHQAAPAPNYNISSTWMKRVVEVVNYAAENDMYIILNTHHDEEIFKFMDKDMEKSKKAFQKIWAQISYVFCNYNEKLIFEGLNEPRTKGSSNEWSGGTPEERNNLNAMHQIFVDTVRASGGNNVKRILMISTYAASVEAAAVDGLKLPTDSANSVNKLIVSTHSYSPYNFALNEGNGSVKTWSASNSGDTSPITTWINRVNTAFVKKGYPVIGGEFGAINRDNEDARAEWAEYYVSKAKEKGIKCVYWDDGGNFKLYNRSAGNFYFPKVHTGLMKGAGLTVAD